MSTTPTDPRDAIRPLSQPTREDGQPWRCISLYAHECDGIVVGAVGPIPCCAAGAAAEQAWRVQDRERIARYMVEHADELAAEAAAEQAWEQAANLR